MRFIFSEKGFRQAAFLTTTGMLLLSSMGYAQGYAQGQSQRPPRPNPLHEHSQRHHQHAGLIGENTTDEEVRELRHLFDRHREITRSVENLPNGIRTTTTTSNQRLLSDLISHSVGMMSRVEAGDDPEVPVQSPTLDVLFRHGDEIFTEFEILDDGIVIIQTSNNPNVVEALQTHAQEVTELVDRGMAAVASRHMTGQGHRPVR